MRWLAPLLCLATPAHAADPFVGTWAYETMQQAGQPEQDASALFAQVAEQQNCSEFEILLILGEHDVTVVGRTVCESTKPGTETTVDVSCRSELTIPATRSADRIGPHPEIAANARLHRVQVTEARSEGALTSSRSSRSNSCRVSMQENGLTGSLTALPDGRIALETRFGRSVFTRRDDPTP